MEQVLKIPVSCIGCGRTDAQVHASQFFFHVDLLENRESDLLYVLNKTLPDDIVIFEIIPVDKAAHAQFDALERTYDYFVHTTPDPFLSDVSALYLIFDLDITAMNKAMDMLPNYSDFRAFCKTPDRHNHTLCQLSKAQLSTNTNHTKFRFQFTANRFLKNMVRLLVGNILEVGKGMLSLEEFERHLAQKEAPRFNNLAYPQGLFLSKVRYPFLDIPAQSTFPDILTEVFH